MILYKYLPPARLDVLRDKRIRFTQPGDFNDPFEFRPRIDRTASNQEVLRFVDGNFEQLVEEQLSRYGNLADPALTEGLRASLPQLKRNLPALVSLLEPEMLGSVSGMIDGLLNENVGVLCLSESRDSLLMWGHYTCNHRGFVIGFDSNHPFFSERRSDKDEFGILRKVNYTRSRPNVVLSDTSSSVWFQTKSEVWSYECEWRLVKTLAGASSRIDRQPFPTCLFKFPPDAVREIITGMRSAPEFIEEIRSLAAGFPRAQVLKARENPFDYALIIDPLS